MRAAVLTAMSVVSALALTGCGTQSPTQSGSPTVGTSATPAPAATGRIVFRRFLTEDETQGALFTSRTDGSDERQLTRPSAGVVDDEPAWSPDGSRIVFTRITVTDEHHESHRLFVV